MRGYFGIGVEGISKEGNLGNLVRTAHAFGASFFFVIRPVVDINEIRVSDTSGAFDHMPFHVWNSVQEMDLPEGCSLTGIEFMEDSIEMPSFRHPTRGAYVLGPEMGDLSPELIEKCDHIVKIPSKFCINVGVAGALTMYDRMISMGRYAERPVRPCGKPVIPAENNVTRRRKTRTNFNIK
ncbi:MAG: TrmH family RNA methyltransferase [Rhodospirillales bacterium]|nr:TrmH family RNA methyltransferase [Alphaproteobacteria bacterium]USO04218.1 MAG: TrmH family RNA methyltransferase [Rhodospirillales bacterium]